MWEESTDVDGGRASVPTARGRHWGPQLAYGHGWGREAPVFRKDEFRRRKGTRTKIRPLPGGRFPGGFCFCFVFCLRLGGLREEEPRAPPPSAVNPCGTASVVSRASLKYRYFR